MNDAHELDERLTAALAARPVVAISDDFTLRVMERIPAQRMREFVPDASRVGRRFGFAALALLAATMFGLVPLAGTTGHGAVTAVEWTLCAELVGLTLWLSPVTRLFER